MMGAMAEMVQLAKKDKWNGELYWWCTAEKQL